MLSEYEKYETGIRSIDAHHLITLSFRTRNLSKIQPHLDKVFDDFSSVIEGKELKSSDKISLEQFGTLHDLSALNETMFFYRDLGIIKGNPQLERLFNDTCSAKDIITHLDKTFE